MSNPADSKRGKYHAASRLLGRAAAPQKRRLWYTKRTDDQGRERTFGPFETQDEAEFVADRIEGKTAVQVARRLAGEIEMLESPDLAWRRFVESLSPENRAMAGGLFSESMIANPPQNPQAQIRAIRRRLSRPDD